MQVRELQIVNPDPKYGRVALKEPTTLGYMLIAAEVQPRRAPFVPNSREKSALLAQLGRLAQQIQGLDGVEMVTIFDAIVFAPPSAYIRERGDSARVPRFDVVVLIETVSPAAAREVERTSVYHAFIDSLNGKAKQLYTIAARNAKRIGDVDKTKKGTFLFNFFSGDDREVVLDLWDYLAGWYATETGLDNSILLVPLDGERSNYVAVNNARWEGSLLGVLWQQITKPTFRTYLLANLEANHVGAMPVIYRLSDPEQPPNNRVLAVAASGALIAGAIALGVGLVARRRRRRA